MFEEFKEEFMGNAEDSGVDNEQAWEDLLEYINNNEEIPFEECSWMPEGMRDRLESKGWSFDGGDGIPPD
ncbi:MAG: hypothetical protein C4518_04890 [Desulfobacteraceae bacterium]|nr:MAG: hypothetical protein C4518_04890 [Desulfobacteraceae bacterium]